MAGRVGRPKTVKKPARLMVGLWEVWETRLPRGMVRPPGATECPRFPSPGGIAPDEPVPPDLDATGAAISPGRLFPQAGGGACANAPKAAMQTGLRAAGGGARRAHGASIGKRSPNRIANSARAWDQNCGGRCHFRSILRNCR